MDVNRALRDFAAPNAQGMQSSITRPAIEANNFEISLLFCLWFSKTNFQDLHLKIIYT